MRNLFILNLKIFFILILFFYVIYAPISLSNSIIESYILIIFSIVSLIKSRNNFIVFILFLIIFYVNYSIVVGEFLFSDDLSVPMIEVKNELNYGINLRILLLFNAILSLFYIENKLDKSSIILKPEDNPYIFYFLYFVLIFILIFGIDRTSSDSYSVRISTIFEYSKILFLFAYFYSGRKEIRIVLLIVLMLIFVISDFVYGGRITAFQLIILLILTILLSKLNIFRILIISFLGIITANVVSSYRGTSNFSNIDILNQIKESFSNLLINDTSTFSFYSSGTHIASYNVSNIYLRLSSFMHFVFESLTGIGSEISDVTRLARLNGFVNYGGGLFPTHFYYWFGWSGVIFSTIILLIFINKVKSSKSNFWNLMYYSLLINSPRWFLYSPNQFFRAIFVITPIFYVLMYFIHRTSINNFTTKNIKRYLENN